VSREELEFDRASFADAAIHSNVIADRLRPLRAAMLRGGGLFRTVAGNGNA
jgi:hypothetical protein